MKACAWRALADQSREKILNADSSRTKFILELWSYRFRALYKLRLPTIILREMIGLFQTIACTFSLSEILLDLSEDTLPNKAEWAKNPEVLSGTFRKKSVPDIIPFSILVLRARLPMLLRPNQQEPVLKTCDGLLELLEGSRRMVAYYQHFRNDSQKDLWVARVRELIGLLISSLSGHGFQTDSIIEQVRVPPRGPIRPFIPDRALSIELIRELVGQESDEQKLTKLIEEEIKLRIEMGDLEKTDELFEQLHHKSRNQATSFSPYKLPVHPLSLVRLIAAGQLDQATDLVRSGLSSSSVPVQNYFENQSDLSLINNFCIALLYSGKLNQGFPILRRLIEKFGSEKNEPHSRSVNNEEEGTSHNIEGQGNNNSDAKDNRSESKSNQSLEESLDSSSLTEENILHQSEMLNSLIFNYSTFIELNFGIDCDQIKQDFLNQLIRKFSKSNSSKGSTSSNDPVAPLDLHRFLDLISLNSFKFPASYFNS